MSHTTSCDLVVTNEAALLRTVAAENLHIEDTRRHEMFDGKIVQGIGVKLAGWDYPVIFDTKSGKVHYDNYNERWGKQDTLDKFMQRYSLETLTEQAQLNGLTNEYVTQANGDIVLYCDVNA